MPTITKEVIIKVSPDEAWAAISDVGAAHQRLFPGVLTDCRMDGDVRIATFANGLVLRELIVTVDDANRRFVYASVGGRTTHHNASLQVFAEGDASRIVWVTDFLPEEMSEVIQGLVDKGAAVMKQTLEEATKVTRREPAALGRHPRSAP